VRYNALFFGTIISYEGDIDSCVAGSSAYQMTLLCRAKKLPSYILGSPSFRVKVGETRLSHGFVEGKNNRTTALMPQGYGYANRRHLRLRIPLEAAS
jgi:Transposase